MTDLKPHASWPAWKGNEFGECWDCGEHKEICGDLCRDCYVIAHAWYCDCDLWLEAEKEVRARKGGV